MTIRTNVILTAAAAGLAWAFLTTTPAKAGPPAGKPVGYGNNWNGGSWHPPYPFPKHPYPYPRPWPGPYAGPKYPYPYPFPQYPYPYPYPFPKYPYPPNGNPGPFPPRW